MIVKDRYLGILEKINIHLLSQTNSKAFQKYNIIEIKPGSNCNSQIDLLNYIKDNAGSLYHPIGTCRMGVDKNSVVNQDLQVRGILGLRVADASIMPSIISGNTNATVIMIAEKASEIIKKSFLFK